LTTRRSLLKSNPATKFRGDARQTILIPSRRFDPSRSSHAFRPSERLSLRRRNGPKIPAFCAFTWVSGLRLCRTRDANRRKSPAVPANIPVLRRLSAEKSSIRTDARVLSFGPISRSRRRGIGSLSLGLPHGDSSFLRRSGVARVGSLASSCESKRTRCAHRDFFPKSREPDELVPQVREWLAMRRKG
jgi:hypothetical protein